MRHVLAHNGGSEQRIVDHLGTLLRRGGALYLVDVHMKAMAMYPAPPGLEDLNERYRTFLTLRGSDPAIGLRLASLAETAGLTVETFQGLLLVNEMPPGLRPPAWAARTALLEAGVVNEADLARWGEALEEMDAATERPRLFSALLAVVARRPES
jgi:hypothetical protein